MMGIPPLPGTPLSPTTEAHPGMHACIRGHALGHAIVGIPSGYHPGLVQTWVQCVFQGTRLPQGQRTFHEEMFLQRIRDED